MRTFRLIGMTLLMVMLTVNFTACSDDDDDNEDSFYEDEDLEENDLANDNLENDFDIDE